MMRSVIAKRRRWIALSLLVITPIGFFSKHYQGIAQTWVNHSAGGILYEIFWCLLLFGWFPQRKAITPIVGGVLVSTCLLEGVQLWQTPLLQAFRSSWLGRILIGTTFSWWDFPYYVLGSAIAWLWLRTLVSKSLE